MAAAQTLQLVSLVDLDRAYAAYPRARWKGKLMAVVRGTGADEIGVGAKIHVAPKSSHEFEAVVIEVPTIRLAESSDVALVVEKPAFDALDGQATIEGGDIQMRSAERGMRS